MYELAKTQFERLTVGILEYFIVTKNGLENILNGDLVTLYNQGTLLKKNAVKSVNKQVSNVAYNHLLIAHVLTLRQ